MAKELVIAEYVPRRVVRLRRVCKCLLTVCLGAVVILFCTELAAIERLRTECDRYEAAAVRFKGLTEEGDAACGAGEKRLGELYYLTALQMNPTDSGLYLKLSRIYEEYRYYELALEILEAYSGEDEEITAALDTLRKEIERLEVSQFHDLAGIGQ